MMNIKLLSTGALLLGTVGTGATFAADARQNPYIDKGTHYELPIVSDIPQDEKVLIAKDKAAMTLTGWRGEYAITIIPQIPGQTFGADAKADRSFKTQADRPLLSKKMEYRNGDVTAFIEPKEGTANEFDIDFTLHAKPETNVFEYKIEGAEEFEFRYQTDEFCASEGITCPDNVRRSYALYHTAKADHILGSTNYATGKIFHIYRPKAIDATGAEVWAELSYSEGVLSVTVPEKWLETAAYPVVVDPTFGYTLCGASISTLASATSDTSTRVGFATTTSVTGTLDSLHACLSTNTAATEMADTTIFLNVENAGADSHVQVAAIETLDLLFPKAASPAIFNFTAASESITPTTYVLNIVADGEDIVTNISGVRVDTGAPSMNFYSEAKTGAGGYASNKETPWTEDEASSTNVRSIYATYSTIPTVAPRQSEYWYE